MPLLGLYSRDRFLRATVERAAGPESAVAATPSWPGLVRTVRERPVSVALLDLGGFGAGGPRGDDALAELRGLFPRLGIVALARMHDDPMLLFHLGRAGVRDLVLLPLEDLRRELPRALARASAGSTPSVVLRRVSPYLPGRETAVLRRALEDVHRRWGADEFAALFDYTRPHLSERLKRAGLPSAGHLLMWVRLLHAGRWLEDPGRTGESVARQLEYSSGAAFRRALRVHTGATPTAVIEKGGLSFVLDHFTAACGFPSGEAAAARISVA